MYQVHISQRIREATTYTHTVTVFATVRRGRDCSQWNSPMKSVLISEGHPPKMDTASSGHEKRTRCYLFPALVHA